MKFVADLHIHSHFSRATSKQLNLEHLTRWAQLKGIQVVGTGDIAHPGWLEEMKNKLIPAEEGLFRLKDEYLKEVDKTVFKACQAPVRFMLAGEISNIYKKHDKVRKIHNVVFLPSFEAVTRFQAKLEPIGNIRSDGRPILGLDSRDLLEILLETDPDARLIPAHIWTPWFSLLGSMSGFDSVEECFDDLTPHIFALETGLSSDPPMNWLLSSLDKYTLVSNSDAHSPQKLAREANVFNTELTYPAIFHALKSGDQNLFKGTIEFFPEEGKYHFDGHRKCGTRWDPDTTVENDGICTVCGKPVTVGVLNRVKTLADRKSWADRPNRHPFTSLIPLPEILAEIYGVGVNTKRVRESFEVLLSNLGSELDILLEIPLAELDKFGGSMLQEGIRRMRHNEVHIAAGFDGEFGTIKLFDDKERQSLSSQMAFFDVQIKSQKVTLHTDIEQKVAEPQIQYKSESPATQKNADRKSTANEPNRFKDDSNLNRPQSDREIANPVLGDLNSKQKAAVENHSQYIIISAGPGTGKTRTLTHRIAYLIRQKKIPPGAILAVTFTNKAAQEMAERLDMLLGSQISQKVTISTFHTLAAKILREHGEAIGISPKFAICSEKERGNLLIDVNHSFSKKEWTKILDLISYAKNHYLAPKDCVRNDAFKLIPDFCNLYQAYQDALYQNHTLDFDDLLFYNLQLFEQQPEILIKYQTKIQWIFVDEYQDINLVQYKLLRHLITDANHLFVIGDPDQAIYGFRGADRSYFMIFQEDFPTAEKIQLTENYRSTQSILKASVQIISKSAESSSQQLISEIVSQTKVDIYQAATDKAEAEYVVHQIESLMGGTSYFSLDSGRVEQHDYTAEANFSEIAVLYRLNALSHNLIKAFQRSGIPFQTIGDATWYLQDEIKDCLSFLWFLYNPKLSRHFKNILSHRCIGLRASAIGKLENYARTHKMSLWDVVQNGQQISFLSQNQKSFLQKLFYTRKQLVNSSQTILISEMISCFLDEFNQDDKHKKLFEPLYSKSKSFAGRLGDFLEAYTLRTETDDYEPKSDKVTLMTLHAAKGLEFPIVFIVGCEENLIPYNKPDKAMELEEERRLFYVGMTRAKQKLILTHAKSRFLFGQKVSYPPSRFLNDIEKSLLEFKKPTLIPKKRATVKNLQTNLFEKN